MTYPQEKLGNYIEILSGFAFKTQDFTDKGVPIVKIKNINPPSVTLDDLTYVSYDVAEKQKKFVLSYDDVLIAMTGSHINQWASVVGRVARVKYQDKTLLNQRVGKVTIKQDAEADLDYIYYFLSQDCVKIELAGKAGGAANQANISPSQIKGLMFPCPDYKTQVRIGGILRSYDNLIENNQKQIKLLEEAAQRLYKEWFVDLRFPGYENTPVVDGVPEGWRSCYLCDVCDTIGGGTPSTKIEAYYTDGNIKWVTPTDITKNGSLILLDSEKKITEAGLKNSAAKLLPPYTILMTSRASIGYFALCEHEVCTNQGFINCIPHENKMRYYLLYNLMNRVEEIRQKASGSTFLEINKKSFREFEIIVPPDTQLLPFNEMIIPIICNMERITKQVCLLTQARNRLLPKLMNREIEV